MFPQGATKPNRRKQDMTPNTSKAQQRRQRLKQWLAEDKEFLKTTVREALEDVLEAEMEETGGGQE